MWLGSIPVSGLVGSTIILKTQAKQFVAMAQLGAVAMMDKFNKSATYIANAATFFHSAVIEHCTLLPRESARDIVTVAYMQPLCNSVAWVAGEITDEWQLSLHEIYPMKTEMYPNHYCSHLEKYKALTAWS